jgi:hypothetical protein
MQPVHAAPASGAAASAIAAAICALALALVAIPAQAQQQQMPPPAPPKAYTAVAVTMPAPPADPGLEALRKELAAIAGRKDRAALATHIVTKGFFWDRDDGKKADPKKKPIDIFATAIGLNAADGSGWQTVADYADEPSASQVENHPGALCAPATPDVAQGAFENLLKTTGTQDFEWVYTVAADVEVRDKPDEKAAVIEKLGMILVRVYPDPKAQDAESEWVRIVTPAGKVGVVTADSLGSFETYQVCYIKEGNAWKIAGLIGGGDQ